MKLYQMVLKDIMRRKRRVAYAILGVVIGTMSMARSTGDRGGVLAGKLLKRQDW